MAVWASRKAIFINSSLEGYFLSVIQQTIFGGLSKSSFANFFSEGMQ